MARPLKEINWDVVEKLAEAGCSGTEIAAKFRIQADTFYIRFKKEYGCRFQDYHLSAQESGIADLKAMLQAKAINNKAPGNTHLLIFLAKTRLGMREPDIVNILSPNQDQLDQTHVIMSLQHKIAELEAQLEQREG